jgi:aspartate aminotransferase
LQEVNFMQVSDRAKSIKPSPTLTIDAKAKALKAAGHDVIGFGAGEPDFGTPEHINQAAIAALNAGDTRYTAVGGTDALKKAIAAKLKRDNGLEYANEEIIVSCGAKHALYNLFQAFLNPGDEIIIPTPYWVSYPDMALLAGATPVFVECTEEEGFKLNPERLATAITPRTRLLVLNSPSNPTGAAYSQEELRAIAEVVRPHRQLHIVSDEIYEKLLYDDFAFATIANVDEEMRQRTFVVNGMSKAYAMTGWRLGYTAGDRAVVAAMTKIQGQSTSNPTAFAQAGGVAALNGTQEPVAVMNVEFVKRRNYIVDRLNAIPGVSCLKPEGAFYVFPNISGLFGKAAGERRIEDADGFAQFLLEEFLVAVVPGTGFGAPNYMRLSYATSMENITRGLDRIAEAVGRLA